MSTFNVSSFSSYLSHSIFLNLSFSLYLSHSIKVYFRFLSLFHTSCFFVCLFLSLSLSLSLSLCVSLFLFISQPSPDILLCLSLSVSVLNILICQSDRFSLLTLLFWVNFFRNSVAEYFSFFFFFQFVGQISVLILRSS